MTAPEAKLNSGDEARRGLKNRAVKGTVWVTGGYVVGQGMRLASNLVLTRLLSPELFGLMALVHSVLAGLQMFSDVGIRPSLIQSKNATKPEFLNTAWTVQAVRGTGIALVACLGAPFLARYYGEPELTWLIVVSALGSLTTGFFSTSMVTDNRDLNMRRLTVLQLASQVAATATSLTWAFLAPSVWALVAGAMVSLIVNLIGGHTYLTRRSHRFQWDKDSLHELTTFGRWIFLSTVCGFFVNHADRLIVGKLFTMSELGVYSIAMMLLGVARQLFNQLKQTILLPVYSQVRREEPERFQAMVRRSRITLLRLVAPALILAIVFGDLPIELMFDPRYEAAGPLFQLLCAGFLVEICQESGPVLLSHGDSFRMALINSIRAALQLIGMLVGGIYFGQIGLVVGILLSRLIMYPLVIWENRSYGVWFWKVDLVAHGGCLAVVLALAQARNLIESW